MIKNKKVVLVTMGVIIAATLTLGGLFAQSGTAALTIVASDTARSGGLITAWTASGASPFWSPVQDALGKIDGGGLFHIEVPNNPPFRWTIRLTVDDPDEMSQAYRFWKPNIQVRTMSTENLQVGVTSLRTFTAGAGSASQEDFAGGTTVTDAATGEASNLLTLRNGSVTFVVNSIDGLGVDADGVYQTSASKIVSRAFELGFSSHSGQAHAGTFFTKNASNDDNLSPEFSAEIGQR